MTVFPLVISPEAENDLAMAYHWYEKKCQGLGAEFLQCAEDIFQRVRSAPETHAVGYRGVRQTLMRRFPYVVCYTWSGNAVQVIAVFHGNRDPAGWQSRTA